MFNGMSHARHVLFIAKIPDIDIERSASLVSLIVMHEQCLKLIGKLNNSVFSIIGFGLLQAVCYSFDGTHDRCEGSRGGAE